MAAFLVWLSVTVRRRKDGTPVSVSLVAAPVRTRGGQLSAYVIYRDITERVETQETLRKLSLAVEQRPASVMITVVNRGDGPWKLELLVRLRTLRSQAAAGGDGEVLDWIWAECCQPAEREAVEAQVLGKVAGAGTGVRSKA